MEKITIMELSELELIYGGDGYGSIFHPGKGGNLPLCENYPPAYPGKVLPQC